jgi:hypothetical protein
MLSMQPQLAISGTTTIIEPRFKLVPFNELRTSSAPAYLIKGLIPRVGLTVVWGPPKSGKSFIVFDAMMHVALGWEYRGRKVQQGPVVYCAFEGASGFGQRTEAFRRQHVLDDEQRVPFYLIPSRMDFVKEHSLLVKAIKSELGEAKPAAVVLDTLNRSLAGSESSDEDMAAYVKAADAVREAFDCVVVVVHHCGIDATRPRGHTSLTGAVDAQSVVKRDAANNVILTVEWMKDGPEGDKIVSKLQCVEVGSDEDGDPITSCAVVEAEGHHSDTRSAAQATGAAKLALDLLHKTLADAGEKAPVSNHVPPDNRVVSLKLWRSYCYEGAISPADTPEARQKAFVRASQKLQALNLIGIWGDWVWTT